MKYNFLTSKTTLYTYCIVTLIQSEWIAHTLTTIRQTIVKYPRKWLISQGIFAENLSKILLFVWCYGFTNIESVHHILLCMAIEVFVVQSFINIAYSRTTNSNFVPSALCVAALFVITQQANRFPAFPVFKLPTSPPLPKSSAFSWIWNKSLARFEHCKSQKRSERIMT